MGGESKWVLPELAEPCKPPGEGVLQSKVPPRTTKKQEEGPAEYESLTPEQHLVEANKRCKKRLAALARDHIVKLREEQE